MSRIKGTGVGSCNKKRSAYHTLCLNHPCSSTYTGEPTQSRNTFSNSTQVVEQGTGTIGILDLDDSSQSLLDRFEELHECSRTHLGLLGQG